MHTGTRVEGPVGDSTLSVIRLTASEAKPAGDPETHMYRRFVKFEYERVTTQVLGLALALPLIEGSRVSSFSLLEGTSARL